MHSIPRRVARDTNITVTSNLTRDPMRLRESKTTIHQETTKQRPTLNTAFKGLLSNNNTNSTLTSCQIFFWEINSRSERGTLPVSSQDLAGDQYFCPSTLLYLPIINRSKNSVASVGLFWRSVHARWFFSLALRHNSSPSWNRRWTHSW